MIDPQMFVLVNAENTRQIYAFGIDTGEEAVTFRREPETGKSEFGVHTDADAANRLANRMTAGEPGLKLIRFDFSEPLDDEFVDDVPLGVSRSPEL
ncbi:MAG TPA: hypothetical protein VFX16_24525 [Pseudonocardiaceae bacterium]|nr:hypothetical protein [Pseudonocardiaceae bacterium]